MQPIIFTNIKNNITLQENKKIITLVNKKSDIKYVTNKQWPPWVAWKSSYQIYVDNWWQLNEQEWLDSFVSTYSRTELEQMLDNNFNNFYTKSEIDNKTIDWWQF